MPIFTQNNVQLNSKPLEEWEKQKAIFQNTYEIAREYLFILATSVSYGRLFPNANLLVTQQRKRLSSQRI